MSPPTQSATLSILIDSNIFIAAEDHGTTGTHPYGQLAAELLALVNQLGFRIAISAGTKTDIQRAAPGRQAERLRQLAKYHVLQPVANSPVAIDRGGFPLPLSGSDGADVEVLSTLLTGVSDWLVTQDAALRRRAARCARPERVLSLPDAVETLRRLAHVESAIPAVESVPAYTVRLDDNFFDSLRSAYPDFNRWWTDRVVKEHRSTLIIGTTQAPEGLAVLKPEDGRPLGLAEQVMKLCTFKIAADQQGTKRGELLLKAVIEQVRVARISQLYVEVMPKEQQLLDWLETFGFETVKGAVTVRGERVLAKWLIPPRDARPVAPLEHNIRYGPGSLRVEGAHVVPIRADWHSRLLPEATPQGDLFAGTTGYGNAIRKAYLCHANTQKLKPGDALLLYRTGSGPASVTAIGVVEEVLSSVSAEQIVSFVGQRTVYTRVEITSMCTSNREVLAVLFRLDRVLSPEWKGGTLRSRGVLNGAPQSITQVQPEGVTWIRSQLDA